MTSQAARKADIVDYLVEKLRNEFGIIKDHHCNLKPPSQNCGQLITGTMVRFFVRMALA